LGWAFIGKSPEENPIALLVDRDLRTLQQEAEGQCKSNRKYLAKYLQARNN
jgi:hypothetical protein